ncbi:MAG: hypothetical protein NVS9B12_14990 [Vulcanimicrobiaceae bacterium]
MHPPTLKSLPVAVIVRAIADAAERWSDADFPPRVRITESIVSRTGYSLAVVEYALDRLFFGISRETLEATIVSEVGNLGALDGFVERPGRPDAHARGLDRVCIISSRTTIGVALVPAIFALCAKCEVTVKDREDLLIGAFFETLQEEHEIFAGAARAHSWRGTSDAVDLAAFDAVIAFGKNETLKEIRQHCGAEARFIGFGSRASAGYITREALQSQTHQDKIAEGAARDLVLYESEGCLSLHMLFIETGDDPSVQRFLRSFARSVERAGIEFPLGTFEAGQSARAAQFRNVAAFRAAGGSGSVFSDGRHSFVLVYNPPVGDPPPFAPRCLGIIPLSSPVEALDYVRQHDIALEAFALSDERADLLDAAICAGAVRLTPFGELQRLPVSGDHGGRPRIADYIRWIDKEI